MVKKKNKKNSSGNIVHVYKFRILIYKIEIRITKRDLDRIFFFCFLNFNHPLWFQFSIVEFPDWVWICRSHHPSKGIQNLGEEEEQRERVTSYVLTTLTKKQEVDLLRHNSQIPYLDLLVADRNDGEWKWRERDREREEYFCNIVF